MFSEKNNNVDMYGFCPVCKARGITRERRPNGNDSCENGHVYPSRLATKKLIEITEMKIPDKWITL